MKDKFFYRQSKASLLPPNVIHWLDEVNATTRQDSILRATRDGRIEDAAELRILHQYSDLSASQMSEAAQYPVRLFRDQHLLAYDDQSIASLDISDALLVNLLWNDIFTVDQLQQRLNTHAVKLDLLIGDDSTEEKELQLLRNALNQWVQENSNK